jgi:nitric oxide reductase activation protein
VEYLRVKDFEEPLDAAVKGRIGALAPRRNTRMGAAIRHAAARLEGVAARGRLLLLLGDGFPNDTGYRGVYGIEDTARALDEARARGVNAHALTVTPAGDGRLDRLYGALHYHMIADVRDLPAQLLRIYRHLTRR